MYLTWGEPPAQVRQKIDWIRALAAREGREVAFGVRVRTISRDRLEIHPHLWAGIRLVRGRAGTALVGSHAEVADLIEEYHAVGVEHFVLPGYPHLEEAYWFEEGVIPQLGRRGLLSATGATDATGAVAPTGAADAGSGGAPVMVAGGRGQRRKDGRMAGRRGWMDT